MNGDEENRILAIGILDDLLAQLSRIDALRVTSRTSVNEYADTDKSLDVIARELGVAYILEGGPWTEPAGARKLGARPPPLHKRSAGG